MHGGGNDLDFFASKGAGLPGMRVQACYSNPNGIHRQDACATLLGGVHRQDACATLNAAMEPAHQKRFEQSPHAHDLSAAQNACDIL